MAVQAGLGDDTGITGKALEAHYLAGGNVPLVIRAMIAANKAKTSTSTSSRPRPSTWPAERAGSRADQRLSQGDRLPGSAAVARTSLDAIAKNGIQLKVKARVTVRATCDQLIGGATEETIIARVGEGIVSAIGSADTHGEVLENPDRISKAVLGRDGSIRKPPSRSSRSTSPTSTWATTLAAGCRPTRPKPTCASPGPGRRTPGDGGGRGAGEHSPIEENRAKLVRPRPRFPGDGRGIPRADSGSWTTTSSATSRPTRTCGGRSLRLTSGPSQLSQPKPSEFYAERSHEEFGGTPLLALDHRGSIPDSSFPLFF